MATAGSPPTTPQWDNRNRGFIPPSQLQHLRQTSPLAHEFTPPDRPPRLMTTDSLPTHASSPRPSPATTSSHSRSTSFFSFLKSSDNNTATVPSRRAEPGSQPQLQRVGSSDEHGRLMAEKRQPPLPPSSLRNESSSPALDRRSSLPQTQPSQLHPEIRSVVSLTHAHAHKVYMSGPLIRRIERLPDGHQPTKDEGWRDVWAQLGGTTLSIWDMKEIDEANKQGNEVPPTYINVTDAFVQVLGAVTIPASGGAPAQKYNNVVTLNTAGSNLLLFSCPNAASLISWATALRLSTWEKSRLEEIYTAHLIRITLNDGHDAPSTLVRGRREGWVRIRIAGQTDWKHLWMAITSGPSQEVTSPPARPGSPHEPQRKRRISSLFGRDDSQPQSLSARPLVSFFISPKPKDRKKPFLTLQDVKQAFAVYPERPELINKSTLMKIEGTIGDEEVAVGMRGREGWVLVMPELEAGVPQANETIKWLIAFHDSFSLYGRPRVYSWNPHDPVSMMFAYPAGPARDSLFLDRELAETMDPRDDRTSAVRSRLLGILSLRMQELTSPDATSRSPQPNAPSVHLPLPSTDEPTKGTSQDGSSSLPQLPPLAFSSSEPEALSHRALTPIIEGSGPEKDLGHPITEDRVEERAPEPPKSASPPPVSPPSVYTPTEAASVSVSPPRGSIESSRNASIAKPFAGNVPSELPYVDDGRGVLVASPTSAHSFHSSAPASPPSLSPANSSNPPASLSPAQAPPRTPSPKFSVLTSPHSMMDSPTRAMSQSFAEFGSGAERTSRQSFSPPTALRAASLPSSKLNQEPVLAIKNSSHEEEISDIFDEAGALYYIHQFEQGSPEANPRSAPEKDLTSASASSDFDGNGSGNGNISQPVVAPLRPKTTSPPPQHQYTTTMAMAAARSLTSIDTSHPSHRKPPIQPLPRTPTLDYGPERRPFGARAAPSPASNRQEIAASATQPSLNPTITTRSSTGNNSVQSGSMSQLEDSDADALAALTFLERHEDALPIATAQSAPPPRLQQQPPAIVGPELEVDPPTPESENASVYKSSFAPSKNAMQRKARTEAQQAAHEAATHRPGRALETTKTRRNTAGAWGDSSEEEEDEEDEEDDDDNEDVDSDGLPVAPRDDRSVSNYAASANQRSQYSSPRGPSPLASGDASFHQPQLRPPRNLPPVPPPRGQGHDGDASGPRYTDQHSEAGRKSYYEDGVSHGGAAPHGSIPTYAPAPVAPRHMWSQVLDPGHTPGSVPDNPNARETFIQLDSPAQAMTKAFTPHGLLSAGLQDKEDRSAKKQEELARETGASLINVPSKPPPPQSGLLGAITAHERDRKREGGVGATLTEREREKRLAEERQRKLDELQRQQLEQMQQGGSLYGQQFPGFNPMMNPMMMGMSPMMTGFMGYPGMMPGFGNPQHLFAAQQAAQAYQQAMLSLSQVGSQIGGDGGTPAQLTPMMTGGGMGGASPAPLNPMMTGGSMGMGAFDPRFSMMGMPMMGMGMGMGMGNPGMMGPMGMGMPMNTNSGFDQRMSQFDPGLQPPNPNFAQHGRLASNSGQDISPGPSDGARRSTSSSPRPPQ
ncbi:hypothetical protein B0F90DRAFT_1326973 [Multifurca ochricompacta]|uniref:PH domain-containing protein n=1 Tax=Multifurca ochricompacta TaxID=376703 RepID=A0AAD4QQ36_9AGAM|nr:hypothetical protein B0F90DRAFT_1326973 [Multifurca ochricompacta]